MIDKELQEVQDFQERFDLREPATWGLVEQRRGFLEEELNELGEAVEKQDLVAVFDALLDLVYVAKGTALLLGLPWDAGWAEVHRSNMDKVPGGKTGRLNKDMIKPQGWVGPQLEPLVKGLKVDD